MKTYNLTYASIDEICQDINEYFTKEHANKREITRIRLLAEESLLKYRDEFGEDVIVELNTTRHVFKSSLQINVYCNRLDPFANDSDGIMKSLTGATTDSAHAWKYVKGSVAWLFSGEDRNEIVFSAERESKFNNPLLILTLMVFGTILGIVCKSVMSAESIDILINNYVLPLSNAYIGLVGVMAILLIFFSLPLCMVQYGNAATFQKATSGLVKTFVEVAIGFALLVLVAALVSLTFTSGFLMKGETIKSIFDVFIGFVPQNLVQPFLNFNSMQVMIIGALFGGAFLVIGEGAKGLVSAFDQCNYVAVVTNGYLAKFCPLYAGLMAFYITLSNVGMLAEFKWLVVVTIIAIVIAIFGSVLVVSVKLKASYGLIMRKLMPSFMITMTSGSIGASFAVFFDEIAKDLGVDVGYTGMAANLGSVLYKPVYTAFLAATGFLLCSITGNLTVSTAIQVVVLSVVLAMAIPNIQGGAASIIILLISGLGLGDKSAETVISINAILQFLIVPANILCMQCTIALQAAHDGKINLEKLRAA